MMFITPMPPTSNDRAAMPVSRMVSVCVTEVAVDNRASWLDSVKSAADDDVMVCRFSSSDWASW